MGGPDAGVKHHDDVGKGWQVKPTLWFSTLLDKRLLAGQPNRQNVWFSVEWCRKQ
jgi:hypothetical protein